MWSTVIEVVLLLAKFLLQKNLDNVEAMKLFYKFVHSVNSNYLGASHAESKWKGQAEELNKLLNDMEKEKV